MDGGICRIKLPGGVITAAQAHAVADAAALYAGGVIEATNRCNLQIRGIGADHQGLIAMLLDAGLGPSNPASDDVRNLMLSPTAGVDPQQLCDTRPLARSILDSLENHPGFHELSPKFALSLDGGEGLAMLEHPHDLWLSAMRCEGETLMAFGLAGCPADDSPIAAVPMDQAHALVISVLEVFLVSAPPEQTRMRHLLAEMSIQTFLQKLPAKLKATLRADSAITTRRRRSNPSNRHVGIYQQAEPGRVAVGAAVPLGRLDPSMLAKAANLAVQFGDGTLSMTPWQSLMLRNVALDHATHVLDGLRDAGLITTVEQPLSQLIACTGSAACVKGLADTKADARKLADLLTQSRPVHLSGCIRSCAAAHTAPVTLLAVGSGCYNLYFRDADQPGFGELRGRDLTIEAVGAQLNADSRSNTDD